MRIVKKLDRDLPDGFPQWTMYIFAKDEGGGPTGIENYVELVVSLEDINDNAPHLDMPDGLVWYENKGPGVVGTLQAADYDTPENGGPFTFSLDGGANHDIKQWFEVGSVSNGSYVLRALVTFDRERRKSYNIPVKICDHKNLCDVSNLLLTIGDINDNPMEPGHSEVRREKRFNDASKRNYYKFTFFRCLYTIMRARPPTLRLAVSTSMIPMTGIFRTRSSSSEKPTRTLHWIGTRE